MKEKSIANVAGRPFFGSLLSVLYQLWPPKVLDRRRTGRKLQCFENCRF